MRPVADLPQKICDQRKDTTFLAANFPTKTVVKHLLALRNIYGGSPQLESKTVVVSGVSCEEQSVRETQADGWTDARTEENERRTKKQLQLPCNVMATDSLVYPLWSSDSSS